MNIYDFDDTIYEGDTGKDIVKYGLKKEFKKTFKALRKARKLKKEYEKGLIEFEKVKEATFSFIFELDDPIKFVREFVNAHIKNIKPWYVTKKTNNDVIISASYELWINEFARRLGVRGVIATRTDLEGHILGKNCKGEEKVIRFRQAFPQEEVHVAYGNEVSDIPMLKLAQTAFVVNKNRLIQYSSNYRF